MVRYPDPLAPAAAAWLSGLPTLDLAACAALVSDLAGRGGLVLVEGAGGLLVRFDDPSRPSDRPDFTSDGKRFYFTIDDRQSDVWIAALARP